MLKEQSKKKKNNLEALSLNHKYVKRYNMSL